MFSGITEDKARVKRVVSRRGGLQLMVASKKVAKGAKVGDSICVNGVCLSIVKVTDDILTFDVMKESLRKTNLRRLAPFNHVNLERSLMAGDRISGHFLTGHIDCVGVINKIYRGSNDFFVEIALPHNKMIYLTEKGSVAVEGVSLTVGELKRDKMRVYLIPLTRETTTLGQKKVGDEVNIEFDILGKYALKKHADKQKVIDENFLRNHGFI